MKLTVISAGNFKCDGGSLFSVIPKVLWNKVMPCDDNNFVKLALRCLLVDQGERKILIETGTGDHYDEKFRKNQGLDEKSMLEDSLTKAGYTTDEITDVFLTHLHWDHFNGSVKNVKGKVMLTFPNASYWCSLRQWDHSKVSNVREKVAYYTEFLQAVYDSGRLHLVEYESEIIPGIEVRFFNGHTPGQMIPFIRCNGKTVVYMSDLIPTAANIPLVWLAAYDLYPVITLEEKERFLNEAVEKELILFFEHDFYTECATVERNEKDFFLKNGRKLADFC